MRKSRQRLYQLAREAHQNDDLRLELDIYREIIRTLQLDEDLESALIDEDEPKSLVEILSQDIEDDD